MEFLTNKANSTFNQSRRKFLVVTALITGGLYLIKKLWKHKEPAALQKTTKFLTRDGTLVEVDVSDIPIEKKSANKQQVVSWIWKDQKL